MRNVSFYRQGFSFVLKWKEWREETLATRRGLKKVGEGDSWCQLGLTFRWPEWSAVREKDGFLNRSALVHVISSRRKRNERGMVEAADYKPNVDGESFKHWLNRLEKSRRIPSALWDIGKNLDFHFSYEVFGKVGLLFGSNGTTQEINS